MAVLNLRKLLLLGAVALLAGGCGRLRGAPAADPDAAVVLPADAGAEAVAPSPSAGCGAALAYGPGTTAASLAAGGVTRSFRVHVPPSATAGQPLPVVLMLHGGGGSGRQLEEASSGMSPIADREGFIAVYPDGTGLIRTWNGGNCCGRAVADQVDDVGFVSALLDHLESRLCVDRRRVFASGMSNGGIMSHRLACELSGRIAAIAPVAGTMGVSSCQPTRPVAVMTVHGTEDAHVPLDGGVGCGPSGADFTSVPGTMAGWRARNGCEDSEAPYFSQGDGQCTAAGGCDARTVLCLVEGGGHSWPGGVPGPDVVNCPGDGPQSTTFPASEIIWAFFEANPMRP